MKGVIDRFEGEFAIVVFDDGKVENVKKDLLQQNAKEGDVIVFGEKIYIDFEETIKRKEKAKIYLELWKE